MPCKFSPKFFQLPIIKRMVSQPALGVLLEPGFGKTGITYAALRVLKKAGVVRRALVISPLRPMRLVWPDENKKWGFDFKLITLHGPDKLARLKDPSADVYLINPEGIDWLEEHWSFAPKFDMLVVDESSKFRNTGSQRWKRLKDILPDFDRRYILTGSPAPKNLINLFGQVYLLDGGEALGKFITHFRMMYCNAPREGEYEWSLQDGAEERIIEKVKPLVVALSGKDYLQLPPLIEPEPIRVEMPAEAQRIYDELEEDLITQLDNGEWVRAKNMGVLTMKLRQVANGGIYTDAAGHILPNAVGSLTSISKLIRQTKHLHYAKAEAVRDLIDELEGKPALIAYEFHHDLERLKEVLGKDTPHLGHDVSAKQEAKIIEGWNRGDLPAVLGQPQSVALGLNMQAGRAVIWHSLTWDAEVYDQFIRRVYRQGQTERVFNYRIVAAPVDDDMIGSLAGKLQTQDALMKAFRLQLRKRRGK